MIHDVKPTSERDVFNRLIAASILLGDDMERGLAARGLTRARVNALWEVAQGPLTQREIADRLRVTPRNVTGLIDALERTGFVTRTGHETDRRAVLVKPTRKGANAVERMDAEANALAKMLFADLSAAEMKAVGRALDRVIAVTARG